LNEAALTLWQRDPATLWRRVGDSLVLLAPGQAQPVGVVGSAGVLWDLLAAPVSVAELSERLADSYGTERADLEASVLETLRALQSVGAITTLAFEGSRS
jgi:hypothetical protein